MAFIFIFNIVSEFGFKQALIQAQDNDQLAYSSVFHFNLGFGIVLAALTFLLAPSIATFYEEPELVPIIRLLAGTILLNSLTVVQIAILSKQLAFKELSIRIIIAKVTAAVVGIVMAYEGFGVYALIWQEIVFAVLNAILLWYVSDWRPSMIFSWKPLKKLYNFGVYLFFNRMLNEVITRLDELLVGKIFSTSVLGYFDRSNSISQNINGVTSKSIYNVFFPVMSNIQDEPRKFERMYETVLTVIAITSFGITGVAYLGSEAIIIGLFGDQWQPSVPIFEILMFKLFTYPASRFLNVALLAKGHSKQHFLFGLIRKALRLSTYIVAFYYGFEAFLYASVAVSFVNIIFSNIINNSYLGVSLISQFKPLLICSLILLIAIVLVRIVGLTNENIYIETLINGSIFAMIYGSLSLFINRRWLKELIAEFRK